MPITSMNLGIKEETDRQKNCLEYPKNVMIYLIHLSIVQ